MKKRNNNKTFSEQLLYWYDNNRRNLPWRAMVGEKPNPYFVYLSEIMLQQTVVKTVIPYFLKFVKKWPSIKKLANADFQEISQQWSGLGYYRRAKNLHETAKQILKYHNGIIPNNKQILLSFPGIGEYTSSAIIAIAFGGRANVVDGNIERIFSRLFKIETPLKDSKHQIFDYSEKYLPLERYGDYAQALMDLGSLICIPKNPRCSKCPIIDFCEVGGDLSAKEYPKKGVKIKKPERFGLFYCLLNKNGDVLVTTNKDKGLLANMDVIPSVGWYEEENRFVEKPKFIDVKDSLFNFEWQIIDSEIVHTFTHFKLNVSIATSSIKKDLFLENSSFAKNYKFVKAKKLKDLALPSIMKKIIKQLEHDNIIKC
jgi:A/G-specific adenine glycosylase